MSYPALYIAKYFIKKATLFNSEMTPMKLIKLVYIAHGWYLALAKENYAKFIDNQIIKIYYIAKKASNNS